MSRGKHSHEKRWRHRGVVVSSLVVLTLAVLGAGSAYAAYSYEKSNEDLALPGISVAGVDVGGLTREDARAAVEAVASDWLTERITVEAGGESWNVSPSELGVTAELEPALDQAFSVADDYSWIDRAMRRFRDEEVGASFDIAYVFDKEAATEFVKSASGSVLKLPVDASVAIGENGGVVFKRSKPGRELEPAKGIQNLREALKMHLDQVQMPLRKVEPKVGNKDLGKTIVVDLSANTLVLYDGFKVERDYRVATAAPGFETPLGTWTVIGKVENPTWINPAPNGWGAGEPAKILPGPGNPLGTRALYLDAPGIRIHGTYSSDSIGTHASHGCIRMLISDSEDLYPRVPVGSKVLIVE
jgi:lipoprotein-anchoring transpeptidase ErfK/SrfK